QYKIEVGSGIRVLYEGDATILQKIATDIREFIGINAELVALAKGELERFEGKAKRLVRV
ncbi:MAG: phenylacetate--CoA ligase family protein, partial [Archaeoglobaceae archaeon]